MGDVKRVGQNLIEFAVPGEGGGTRHLARISSIQLVSETDCLGNEIILTVGGSRTFRIDASIDEMRDVLVEVTLVGKKTPGAR